MKNKFSYIIPIIGLILGFLVYSLFNRELLVIGTIGVPFFITTAVIGSAFLLLSAYAHKRRNDDFCGCGMLSAIGAASTTLLSLLLILVSGTGTIFFIFIGVLLFFIVLMIGGLLCYLYNANSCGSDCCSCTRNFDITD